MLGPLVNSKLPSPCLFKQTGPLNYICFMPPLGHGFNNAPEFTPSLTTSQTASIGGYEQGTGDMNTINIRTITFYLILLLLLTYLF